MDENRIAKNWNILMETIDTEFSGDRKIKLKELYTVLEERIMFMPASGYEHFHNCFPGGYIDHVLNVLKCTKKVYEVWKEMGADVSGYTKEELIFSAIHHDLGKVGTREEALYKPNTSEWHRKNQGKLYIYEKNLHHMTIPHRGLWLLQDFGVKCTENETIAILTHDGMYDESNNKYLKAYGDDQSLKTNLPLILHQGDLMAARIEYDIWRKSEKSVLKPNVNKYVKKVVSDANIDAKDLFKGLFGESN